MARLVAQWTKVAQSSSLQRSSQSIVAHSGKAYIFGGELKPREPRDNDVLVVDLDRPQSEPIKLSVATNNGSSVPIPRVGHAAAVLGSTLYVSSGRGGLAMDPVASTLDTNGDGPLGLWKLSLVSGNPSWTRISDSDDTPSAAPQPRSYHAIAADKSAGKLYLHAGCPASGRLADLWSFDPSTSTWTELEPAPGPARGGPSLAFASGLLFRVNGFDGRHEVGGSVDIYDPSLGKWSTVEFDADGKGGPLPRSVGALVPVEVDGASYLVSLFGEGDPSSLGHAGAGKMFGDAWAWDVEGERWSNVEFGEGEKPSPRGWFAAAALGGDSGVVQGGLAGDNQRLDDLWTFRLSIAQ